MIRWLYFVVLIITQCRADYRCVCNNLNNAVVVYGLPTINSIDIGKLDEYICKPLVNTSVEDNFLAIMFNNQIGYLVKDEHLSLQFCPGTVPDSDKVTTLPTSTPRTTPMSSSTTLGVPGVTTLPITTPRTTPMSSSTTLSVPEVTRLPTTTPRTTPMSTSTTLGVPEGHTDLCPDYIKNTDVSYYHGFLGQYGNYCYELVNALTQWENARRHCIIYGDLAHIPDLNVQNYITRWLNANNYNKPVWIGLTDSGPSSEGTWRWSTGEPYSYNNFKSEYIQHSSNDHKINDCVVLKPPTGEWVDTACGLTLIFGAGTGESHPYICQYNISNAVAQAHFFNVLVG